MADPEGKFSKLSNDPTNIEYENLKLMIKNWLNREDLSDSLISQFISLAERKIFRILRSAHNEKTGWYIVDNSDGYLAIPNDFLEQMDLFKASGFRATGNIYDDLKSFNSGNKEYYRYLPPNLFFEKNECSTYTRVVDKIYTYPVSKQKDFYQLSYYADLSGLNSTGDSNILLINAPDLYLYGSLLEAETFLINDERIPLWQAKFNESLQAVNQQTKYNDYKGSLILMKPSW